MPGRLDEEEKGANATHQIPPGPNDIRGSCPGLNILANYGYINRNGVGSLTDLIFGSNKVFGMGLELATWLSTYSAVMAGDLTTVSIGGTPKKPRQGLVGGLLSSVGTGLGLFGQPQGLSHSHNRFEADVSPTRGDLYITYVNSKTICPSSPPLRGPLFFLFLSFPWLTTGS